MVNDKDYKYILEVDSEIKKIQDFDLLLERILLEARKVVNADAGSIYVREMIEKEGAKVEELAIKYSQNDTLQKKLPLGQKLAYSVFTVPINEKTISGYCAFTKELVTVQSPDSEAFICNTEKGVPSKAFLIAS